MNQEMPASASVRCALGRSENSRSERGEALAQPAASRLAFDRRGRAGVDRIRPRAALDRKLST